MDDKIFTTPKTLNKKKNIWESLRRKQIKWGNPTKKKDSNPLKIHSGYNVYKSINVV